MSASHSAHVKEAPYYYVPADSSHPVSASISLLVGGVGVIAESDYGFDVNVLDVDADVDRVGLQIRVCADIVCGSWVRCKRRSEPAKLFLRGLEWSPSAFYQP